MLINVVVKLKIKQKELENLIREILNTKILKKCLHGKEYEKECENYFLRSVNHEMYLQEIKQSSVCIFDDKRNYLNDI